MAKATKWTDEKLKALKLPTGKAEQRVLVAPNLYMFLRQRAAGTLGKQWQYRAQVGGTRRWLSLGSFPEVGLARANGELLQHQATQEAAKKGEADHPALVARQKRKAVQAQPTVDDAFGAWMSDKQLGSSRIGGKPVRQRTLDILRENYDSDVKRHIGESKVAKLTREAIQQCIDGPRKRGAPGAAAQVYRTLRGLVTFSIKRGFIPGADPMSGIDNPRPYKPASVVVAADDSGMATLFRVLRTTQIGASTRNAIACALLTGARPSEVRLATWAEVNFERHQWTIPAIRSKTGKPHTVHLSGEMVRLLQEAKETGAGSDLIFPGSKVDQATGQVQPLEKMAVARALARLHERHAADGLPKLRPHDLRRTFRTMLSRIGIAPHVAELCLGHTERETMRRVYDGHDYSVETRQAWDAAGMHIATLQK